MRSKRRLVVGQVLQQQARMHQVVGTCLEVVVRDVVAPNFEVRARAGVEEANVCVRGHDESLIADALAQPTRDRARTRTDFKTAPARLQARRVQVLAAVAVPDRLQRSQALQLGLPGGVEDVLASRISRCRARGHVALLPVSAAPCGRDPILATMAEAVVRKIPLESEQSSRQLNHALHRERHNEAMRRSWLRADPL